MSSLHSCIQGKKDVTKRCLKKDEQEGAMSEIRKTNGRQITEKRKTKQWKTSH